MDSTTPDVIWRNSANQFEHIAEILHSFICVYSRAIVEAMKWTWFLGISFLVAAFVTIFSWAITPFIKGDRGLPLPAWYPFDHDHSIAVYIVVWFYQVFGILMSAVYNVATDTLVTGLLAHVHGQIERLGIMLSKVIEEIIRDK